MKISTKGRYGLSAMVNLAIHHNGETAFLRRVAKEEHVPEKYLEHIMALLKKANLVHAVRGAHGGYSLARPAAKINICEIIEATEGAISPVGCVDEPQTCKVATQCVVRDVWQDLQNAIVGTLKARTLQDLVDAYRARLGEARLEYSI